MTHWTERAACRDMDPNIFYPAHGGRGAQRAHEICQTCPVTSECLARALRNPQSFDRGIWAGTNHHNRRQLRRTA